MNAQNPYAPPKAAVSDIRTVETTPALWNPSAASSWSLLFTPMFGAYLHMKNWEALDEPEKASQSKMWIIAYGIFFFVVAILPLLIPEAATLESFGRTGGIAMLLAWYFASGKPQQKYVAEHFGKTYPRRGWTKPILSAVGLLFAFFLLAFVAAFIGETFLGVPPIE